MTSSTPATQTTSTTATPSAAQQKLIDWGLPGAAQYAGAGGITLPTAPPIAGFTPSQIQGQTMALGAAQPQGNIVGAAGTGNEFLSSGAALDLNQNKGLQGAINYALQPIQQNYERTVMPQIASGAAGVGGFGGSQEDKQKQIASEAEERAVAGTTSSMVNTAYQNAIDNMVKAQAIAPSVAQAQTIPAQTTSAVGDVQQALQQAGLSYDFQRDVFQQGQPLSVAESLLALSGSIPGGTTSSTGQTQAGSPSPLSTAMGLGSIGSSLLSGLSSIGGSGGVGAGLTSLGTGIGGALGGIGTGIGSLGAGLSGALGSVGPALASLLPAAIAI